MSEDRRGSGFDPTITPSEDLGSAPTSASLEAAPRTTATGALPVRYSLGPQLGVGGMGEVLLANDKQIDRDVAIKRMRMAPSPGAVARFVREAKIQGRLDHPAIVPVHELATDSEGRPFFVMKRLTGKTLAERIGSATPLSRQKLLRAFADVCLAIEFAHEKGVIHRDLKPANIMLGDFGEVYVLDWGVARMLDEQDVRDGDTPEPAAGATEVGAILGTPGYIAPELLKGERLDARADVYALGCILYEILAGEPLLPRGRPALTAALGEVDARPSAKKPDVPPELDAICVAATARERDQRPTARELADQIDRFLDGDRDLALRKTLAAEHVDAGRTAHARGDDEASRATAMREAGRALALDPRNAEAAELIGRLMLEPPKTIPAEVHARVDAIEDANGREKLKLTVKVLFSFGVFIPALLYMGIRSWSGFWLLLVTILANIGLTSFLSLRRRAPTGAMFAISTILFVVLIGIIARQFSPFLLAPGLAATSVMLFTMDVRVNWVWLMLAHVASLLVPWSLELFGWMAPTMSAQGGDLVLRSYTVGITMPQAQVMLAVYGVALVVIAAYTSSQMARAQRSSLRATELQAWHLRQLVA